jgi:glucose-6-phosphate-specific signal transduction histidine kinase
LAPHADARTLTVRGTIDGTRLHLEVEDDGPGLAPAWTFAQRARTGLRTVQARVDLANGAPSPLEFHPCAPRGLRVRLSLDCAGSTRSAA